MNISGNDEIDSLKAKNAANARPNPQGRWITASLCGAGIALQFMAPLLRDRVPLSDDLLITSMLAPWWLFMQAVLLALWLGAFRSTSGSWSIRGRTGFAVSSAAVFVLLEPDLITQLISKAPPLSSDPVRFALIWSSPLAFYLLPATLVVISWLRRDGRLSLVRALGIGLVIIGLINFPFILWLTHLWAVYIRPLGT